MEGAMLDKETANTTGAIIFTLYVLAALVLTALLCRDLINEFLYLPKKLRNDEKFNHNLQAFTALAILSFSVLSYHMLDFLIESYESWANVRNVRVPAQLFGKAGLFGSSEKRVALHIWEWLTTSSLFYDFARTICEPAEHFWWTQQALLATMAWNTYLALEGPKRQIKNLWAYCMIAQILPVSFAQNLFFIAMLMKPEDNKKKMVWTPHFALQAGPLLAYSVMLSMAPYTTGSQYFMTTVAIIRLSLSWPLVARMVLPETYGQLLSNEQLKANNSTIAAIMSACTVCLVFVQTLITLTFNGFDPGGMLKAVNDNPAVSALGYDYILSLLSAATWYVQMDET